MQPEPTILIPIRVLEGESIPEGVPELVANARVILLGYHVVPDQTSTDQARSQFEDKGARRLTDLTEILEHAGAAVESRLVFTHDGQQTIDRVTAERDCLAVLIPNATRPIENVLVPIRGIVGIDRFVRLISGLFGPSDVRVTLYHVAEADESGEDVETLLDGIAARLSDEGVSPEFIDTRIAREDDSQAAIVETADDYDAIVMGESDPSLTTFLFGMTADQVADRFLGPVFVIQHGDAEAIEDAGAEAIEDAGAEAIEDAGAE